MGRFCECTNAVACAPHRCQFVDANGRQCKAPRLCESAGCNKHRKIMPRIAEIFEDEQIALPAATTLFRRVRWVPLYPGALTLRRSIRWGWR